MLPKEYQDMKSTNNISQISRSCLKLLHHFPFAYPSLNSRGISNVESALEENDTVTLVWAEFENIARKHSEFSRSAILMLTAFVASNSMKKNLGYSLVDSTF